MVLDDSMGAPAGDEPDRINPVGEGAASGPPPHDVTQILSRIEQGDGHAAERLLPLVYEELRKLAAAKMAQEKPDQTLQATALVHEAYIRLVDVEKAQHWNSRGHFFAAAAEAMRRILVEQERHKGGIAAGGKHRRISLSHVDPSFEEDQLNVLALSDALDKLRGLDPRAAELVKLRFFAGLTRQQAADVLGVSVATADNDWVYAKCWLQLELTGTAGSETQNA
jgi:RNA polymerase sigma factor (TIGR02999 family)